MVCAKRHMLHGVSTAFRSAVYILQYHIAYCSRHPHTGLNGFSRVTPYHTCHMLFFYLFFNIFTLFLIKHLIYYKMRVLCEL
jgi:hypothetical protein